MCPGINIKRGDRGRTFIQRKEVLPRSVHHFALWLPAPLHEPLVALVGYAVSNTEPGQNFRRSWQEKVSHGMKPRANEAAERQVIPKGALQND